MILDADLDRDVASGRDLGIREQLHDRRWGLRAGEQLAHVAEFLHRLGHQGIAVGIEALGDQSGLVEVLAQLARADELAFTLLAAIEVIAEELLGVRSRGGVEALGVQAIQRWRSACGNNASTSSPLLRRCQRIVPSP